MFYVFILGLDFWAMDKLKLCQELKITSKVLKYAQLSRYCNCEV